MNRREWMIRAALSAPVLAVSPVAALAVPEPDPMTDVDVQLLKLDVMADDHRQLIIPHDVATAALERLTDVPVTMGWDGPELGRVGLWFIRDGWLCTTINVPASVAKRVNDRTLACAPSLFSTHTAMSSGDIGGRATAIRGAAAVAVLPYADVMWHAYRGCS